MKLALLLADELPILCSKLTASCCSFIKLLKNVITTIDHILLF